MLDWIAGITELTGNWLLGDKKRLGFILNLTCQVLWTIVAIKTGIYGLLLVVIPGMAVNVRNYLKWGEKSKG